MGGAQRDIINMKADLKASTDAKMKVILCDWEPGGRRREAPRSAYLNKALVEGAVRQLRPLHSPSARPKKGAGPVWE